MKNTDEKGFLSRVRVRGCKEGSLGTPQTSIGTGHPMTLRVDLYMFSIHFHELGHQHKAYLHNPNDLPGLTVN